MPKKRTQQSGRELAINGANRVRRETFDGLPIVDATADFTLVVRLGDVKLAKGHEKDHANCVLAKACARQVNASKVAFLRGVAYLELPDAKGNKRVVRYVLGKDAAAIVSAFDRKKTVRGEVSVTLKAPSPSQTLDHIREKRQQANRRRREAVLRGEVIELQSHNARYFKHPNVADMDVRNGTGLVQNIFKKTK